MPTVLDGPEGLKELYANIGEDFKTINYQNYLKAELKELEKQHAGYWERDAGPDDQAWPELAPSTIKRKGHDTILVDKRRLKPSLAQRTGDSIRETYDEGANKGLTFGTEVPYSAAHDQDVGNRPARRHVGTNENHLQKMTERAADYTLNDLKKASKV
jgi:hypothetical protein